MSGFFSYFSLPIILVSLGFAIIPSIFWGMIYWGKSNISLKRALITFCFGMLSVMPILLIDYYFSINTIIKSILSGASLTALVTSIWVGLSEEYSKHLSASAADDKSAEFDQIIDGITYSIYAALGFAFIENIKFFIIGFDRYNFISIPFIILFIFRLLGSTLAHTLFSGIYGYYYGKAKFARFDKSHENYSRRYNFLVGGIILRIDRIKHLLGIKYFDHTYRRSVRQEEILAEGLIVATIIHGMFNFALTMHHAVFIVPMLFVEYSIIIHEFNVKQNREVYTSNSRFDEMHQKAYEKGYIIDNEDMNRPDIGKHNF